MAETEVVFPTTKAAIQEALKAVGVREIGTGRLILCAVPVLVGVVSYFFTAVKFKVITHEDCLLLPKGEKIAKILKL